MWRRLLLATAATFLLGGSALAQATLRPDPTPRVPPQPGQGLPQEDRDFLRRAGALSQAETQAAGLAVQRAEAPELKQLSERARDLHAGLLQQLQKLVERDAPGSAPTGPATPDVPPWRAELARMQSLNGREFELAYLRWQLQAHKTLIALYQEQASGTTQPDLATFAITSLAQIRPEFDAFRQLGQRNGIEIDMVDQPWQY